MWTPISLEELSDKIMLFEKHEHGELYNFWHAIKIAPQKWEEEMYGEEGSGFWAVAIIGQQVIWYNDIEEGFNISSYEKYGTIAEYWCNQDDLREVMMKVWEGVKSGRWSARRGGPSPLKLD